MCELMGLSFARPIPADFSIREFALRCVDNADGWGLAWYPDRSLALVKEARTWRHSGYSRRTRRGQHPLADIASTKHSYDPLFPARPFCYSLAHEPETRI